jgi:hypothetical protein
MLVSSIDQHRQGRKSVAILVGSLVEEAAVMAVVHASTI